MKRRRREFSAAEIESLHKRLDEMLRSRGVDTQPKIAARLLELAQDPDVQIRDYADAIRTDWSLSGRLLRMANSAFYAQRSPVTRVERAVIVIGLERTKAVALGFYLSRATAGVDAEIARRVWGESVFRAALAAQLARLSCPQLAGEAFIVGLMLDCGQALMPSLVGPEYKALFDQANSPGKLFALEYDQLEFTHVDLFAVLARRWKLPRLITRPVMWHHTLPPVGRTSDPSVLLQRLAYYVGSIQLTPDAVPAQDAPLSPIADRLFEISADDLTGACAAAGREYGSMMSVFDDVAARIGDVERVADAVRVQLIEIMDEQMSRSIFMETRGGVEKFVISGQTIEVEPGRAGEVAAFLTSEAGQRLLSCTVNPNKEAPDVIARLLGLEEAPAEELAELVRVMRAMAA